MEGEGTDRHAAFKAYLFGVAMEKLRARGYWSSFAGLLQTHYLA